MLLHYLFCFLQLATGQSVIPRELNLRFQPELRLAFCVDDVNMFPGLFPREEEEPKSSFPENGGCHHPQRSSQTSSIGCIAPHTVSGGFITVLCDAVT